MRQYTPTEISNALEEIQQLDHYTMCRMWRFGDKEIYFRNDLPTSKAFSDRLFNHFGGFTPEISKALGH